MSKVKRADLVAALEANGWERIDQSEWRRDNGRVRLSPDGSDDDTAALDDVDAAAPRYVSYAAAHIWATDIAEFERLRKAAYVPPERQGQIVTTREPE